MTEAPRRDTWHKPTLYAALALLAGASIIGIIVAVSTLSGVDWQPLSRTPNAAKERTIEVQPYALQQREEKAPDRLTSPARRQTYHGAGLTSPAAALHGPRNTPGGGAGADEPPPTVLASGEFAAAVDSGRKVFLPNPAGDCNLIGSNGTMTRAFDDCFAGKRPGR